MPRSSTSTPAGDIGIPAPRALLALFVVALALRLIYLWQIAGSPPARVLFGDGEAYDLWAKRIAAGDWLGSEAFYQAPLYPYLLAVLYAIAGPSLLVVRLVQACCGSAACVLLAGAGGEFFGKRVGLAAGALFAFYPIAIYSDGLIQKTSLEAFLLSVLLLLVAKLHRSSGAERGLWLSAGVTLGLLGLVRENALILAPLLLGAALRPWGRKARVAMGAVFVCGIAAVLLPVGVRNLAVGGSFHLTTYQFGSNLYIGNNPSADGTYAPLAEGGASWRRERDDAVRLAVAAERRPMSPADVSRYWTGRALDFIVHQPGAWLRLTARKVALVWNRVEVGDHESPKLFADASPLLRALLVVWHFGVLCPLAMLGIALTWNAGRRPWLLYATIVALSASVAAFYVFGRYRFSLVPVLMLFAGAGLVELAALARAGALKGRTIAAAALMTAAVAFASNRTIVSPATIDANAYYNLGWKLEGEERADGDPVAARAAYERALAIVPRFADALNNLGNLLAREGRMPEARDRFAAAVAADPANAKARINLARALLLEGKPDAALPHLEEAVRLHPDDVAAREQLAKTLFGLGLPQAAIPHYEAVARAAPSAASHNNLGSALAAAGRLTDAEHEFQSAVALDPAFVEARDNLALTYMHLDDLAAAISQYREVLRLRPGSEQARRNLERAETLQGSRGAAR